MSLQVELISRRGCHLCDEMKALLTGLCQEASLSFRVRDVDREPHLFLYYSHRVPVLLVDSEPVAELRWSEPAVRRKLGLLPRSE
jgi:glutaredoxin